jgi:uncharacterized protein YkwD
VVKETGLLIKLSKRYNIFIVAIFGRIYIMSNTKYYRNKSSWLLPGGLVFILFVGIVISVIQLGRQSNLQSNADTVSPTSSLANCSLITDQTVISSEEQKLLDEINIYRQQNGLNALVWSDSLIRGASWMSNDMLVHQSLGHIDSLGRDTKTRLTDCGYTPYISLGENVNSGTKDSTSTLQAWQHSPPYNANLLNSSYKEAGIALAYNSASNSYYWTLDLGSRASFITVTPSVTITPSPTLVSSSPTPIRLPTNSFLPTITPFSTQVPAPTIDPGYVQNPLDMQLFITAKVFGIGLAGNRNPKHLTRHLVVGIYDMSNKQVAEGSGFIIYDRVNLFRGVIHFGPVPDGTYFVKVLGDHMLRTIVTPTFQVLNSNRLNIIPQVTLRQGDVNDDNIIDINDYNLALSCFQDSRCKNKELIDFNDDGLTNVIDYNVLLQNYWESLGD